VLRRQVYAQVGVVGMDGLRADTELALISFAGLLLTLGGQFWSCVLHLCTVSVVLAVGKFQDKFNSHVNFIYRVVGRTAGKEGPGGADRKRRGALMKVAKVRSHGQTL